MPAKRYKTCTSPYTILLATIAAFAIMAIYYRLKGDVAPSVLDCGPVESVKIPDSLKICKKKFACEERCRAIFKKYTGYEFIKCRPATMKNPRTGSRLELDGFCEKLKWMGGEGVAFEFNGPQHYQFVRPYHRSKKDLYAQQYRDSIKSIWAVENGVALLVISYEDYYNVDKIIHEFIEKRQVGKSSQPTIPTEWWKR